MNGLLGSLLNSSFSGKLMEEMAQKVGLDPSSVGDIVSKVAPELMQKANENFKGEGDSTNLVNMIDKTDLDEIAQNPAKLEDTEQGNAILGELTGSKEKSKELAQNIASSVGVDASAITKLLPMIAPLIAGTLNKQKSALGGVAGDTNSLTSMLSSFIDKDNDGSITDDLMDMAGKFFK